MRKDKRAAIYARVSTERQISEEKTSIENQIDKCLDYAAGIDLAVSPENRFVDVFTGGELQRPSFDRLREAVISGSVNVIIFHVQDRMSRADILDTLNMFWQFKTAGAEIHFTDSGLVNFENPLSIMEIVLKANAAYEERQKIKRRTRDAFVKQAKNGKLKISPTIKYGYNLDPVTKTLVINEEESKIVRAVFDWYTIGDETCKRLGLLAIAHKLTQMGVPTKWDKMGKKKSRKNANTWGAGNVYNILGDEIYTGVKWQNKWRKNGRRDKSEWIPMSVPAIISRETWDMARRVARNNQFDNKGPQKHPALMRNRLFCNKCGLKFTVLHYNRFGHNRIYYQCYGQRKDASKDSASHICDGTIEAPYLDDKVWEKIKQALKEPDKLRAGFEQQEKMREDSIKPDQDYLKRLKSELVDLQTRRAQILDLYLDKGWSKDEITIRRDATEREIQMRLDKIAELEDRIASACDGVLSYDQFERFCASISLNLDDATFEQKEWLLDKLSVRAVVYRETPAKTKNRRKIGKGIVRLSAIVPLEDILLTDDESTNLSRLWTLQRKVRNIPFSLEFRL